MLRAVVFGIMVLGMAGTACGGKKDGGGGAPQLRKGSGLACPQLDGRYRCTDGSALNIRSGQNEEGQPIVNLDAEKDLITDGEIHEYQYGEGSARYSVDCQVNSLTAHIVGSDGGWVKATFQQVAAKQIRVMASGKGPGGQVLNSDLTCELN